MDDEIETGFEEPRPLKGFRKRWATSSVADDLSAGNAEQVYDDDHLLGALQVVDMTHCLVGTLCQ